MAAILQVPGTARLTLPFDSFADRRFLLGTRLVTYDGREFRFGENDVLIEITPEERLALASLKHRLLTQAAPRT
jgi:hypothetical protein